MDSIVVTTTDLHLPCRTGETLHRVYQGEIGLRYIGVGGILRVH